MTSSELKKAILAVLGENPGVTAREIAGEVNTDRRTVNKFLYGDNGISVCNDSNKHWYLHERVKRQLSAVPDTNEDHVEPDKVTHRQAVVADATDADLILEVLESLRKRLLDLTSRNRLLNFRHPKTGSIRIIDELPDQLKEFLADDEKEMRFIPVPDPTHKQLIEAGYIEIDPENGEEKIVNKPSAKEWADWLGLDTAFEAPAPDSESDETKHSDNAIQTMFFPDELETRLRSMRQKANSAIEETGANILYLGLGFLEWYEHRDIDKKRLAPLYLIPARLDRGKLNTETRTYEYRLSFSGEDVLTNISLREKLKNDFGIALPELEDGVNPEEYISKVADAVKTREPNWRTRRFITLCHLNFSKQLLYLDLDPENWPSGRGITDHPLVRQCLAGLSEDEEGNGDIASFGEEHPIDDMTSIHEKYPLIDDADSSQHSALIDAIDGKNLVIEGPPGTGKSQTITNLIAAAIANRNKVLFVAEKSAALGVVKRRLDQAGLGAFCLELHSHRSQKRRVLDDIAQRIKLPKRLGKPDGIASDIGLYEELKSKLRQHADVVNATWKKTKIPIHEILAAATRYRLELALSPSAVSPKKISGDSFTPIVQKTILGHVATFANVYEGILNQLGDVESIQGHPWCGVQSTAIHAFESDDVLHSLAAWQSRLEKLNGELKKFEAAIGGVPTNFPREFNAIEMLVKQIDLIGECDGSEPLYALPRLRGDSADEFGRGLSTYKAIQDQLEDIAQDLGVDSLRDKKAIRATSRDIREIETYADAGLKIVQTREARAISESLASAIEGLADPIVQSNKELSLSEECSFSLSLTGLDEYARFAEIIASLQPEHFSYRKEVFDNDELDLFLPKLNLELAEILETKNRLSDTYTVDNLPNTARIRQIEAVFRQAGAFSWLRGEWRSARRDLISLRANKKIRAKHLKSGLADLSDYSSALETFCENPEYKRVLGDQFAGLDTDAGRITSLRSWYKNVRDEYGIGFGSKVPIGDALIGIPEGLARAIRSLTKKGVRQQVDLIKSNLTILSDWFPGFSALRDECADLASNDHDFYTLRNELAARFVRVDAAANDEKVTVAELSIIAIKLETLAAYWDSWDSLDYCNSFLSGRLELPVGVGRTNSAVVERVTRVSNVAKLIASDQCPNSIAEKLYKEPTKATIDLIRIRNGLLREAVRNERCARDRFANAVQLDQSQWINSSINEIDAAIAKNRQALDSPQWFASWLDYIRAREQLQRLGWENLAVAIEQQKVAPEKSEAAVRLGIADHLAREVLSETPALATFSGLTQEGIRQQFQEYDDRLRALQRKLIAWNASRVTPPPGNARGRVRDYTEMALVERELTKKMRHVPLRQLMARAGNAIQTLKPCFMMGPMSVAQYIRPGGLSFDLIVMDEASQIRPEDAIGAVARGGQLVVVGDSKQLPPTSFFDKLLDDEDEQEDYTAGQQSESILDAALTTFPARRLRWHYRSRHESLIAFSNHQFYGSDLVIFPSPINKAPEYGIQFTFVKRGRFVNRVNREEAAIIAKAVRNHMLTRPEESIGVVAMSAQQREQIERAIEQETKEDAHFRNIVDKNQDAEEPLFVKNLENVQGDERDVIYISMTYGPADVGGKVAQRFGPINSIQGWRRLNVLFTRAKKRMHVFSSMSSNDIVISQSSSRGVQSLKGFLEYAATGNISATVEHTGRDPDSDFEVAVGDALSNHGFECVPQVGVAGYFLDIAVKDPGNSGRYLMAIECDGATYHSAKSTRDRDRLRQRILERLGWRVRRIWSTDWFANPAGQLQPIIDELKELQSALPPITEKSVSEPDEMVESEDAAEESEQDVEAVSAIVKEEVDLESRLKRFNQDVIRLEYPNTAEDRRILRPGMIEALLLYRPTTIWEFQQQIPPYLRHDTEPKEGKYIQSILEIIYESEG